MKKTFREYHKYGASDTELLWKTATFILDTNILLDFYAFGETTFSDYMNVLRFIKKRNQLWMPNRVGYEFFENRMGIINKQLTQYDSILNSLDYPKEKIAKLAEASISHAHLDFSKILSDYETQTKPLREEVEKLKTQHPDHLGTDKVLAELEKIYTDAIIGDEYSKGDTDKIIKLGEERYINKVPPGFKDQDKEDGDKPYANRKYGDLIIWLQMIDYAKITAKPIIFVTNDAKDDWVQYAKDRRKIGPKPALKKEMLSEASVDFELYSSDEFLAHAGKYLELTLNRDSVNEVKKHRKLELKRSDNFTDISSDLLFSTDPIENSHHGTITYNSPFFRLGNPVLSHYLERGLELISYIEDDRQKDSTHYKSMDILRKLYNVYEDMRGTLKRRRMTLSIASSYRFDQYLREANHDLRMLYGNSIPEINELITLNRRILHILIEDLNRS